MEKELNGTQLFIAGSIMSKLSDELKKQSEVDDDYKEVVAYLLPKFDEINKEIAEQVFLMFKDALDRINNAFEGRE